MHIMIKTIRLNYLRQDAYKDRNHKTELPEMPVPIINLGAHP